MLTKWTSSDVCKWAESNKFTACWKGRVVWVVAITMHVWQALYICSLWRKDRGNDGVLHPWNSQIGGWGDVSRVEAQNPPKGTLGSPHCECPASETSQLYARMTTCTDSKQVFPRPTPYMLQMAQVPVMNDSGAKWQNPTWQMSIFSIYVACFIIFNFQLFEEATSPGAAGFPGGQIDPRQSTELANEES